MSSDFPLDATYGPWLISLFLETILYGMGALQCWLYFQWWPADGISIKAPVHVVLALETIQIVFFFRSSYFRFVERFGIPQTDLIWSDSLQLLANYLSAFTVQMYFASRIYRLTKQHMTYKASRAGIYTVMGLAVTQLSAGIAQTIMSYKIRSYEKLDSTKVITTLQTAASLACDIVITVYLCVYLQHHKNGMPKTTTMLNTLIVNAINRGMLTAACSCGTTILFLVKPNTFYFFLTLAPSSKLYMNSMLATLNTRQYIRNKVLSNDMGWNTIVLGTMPTGAPATVDVQGRRGSVSAVDFESNLVEHRGNVKRLE
ncbi:hypothetical protein B0H10DRAFT_2035064 [Mycena sp. CBHHK59/15]|nr:hypothetical protein B0H10DRAFT_2035064 [Mycena sp. CBHHK59/15]